MSINRNTQLSFSTLNDLPLLQVPFEQVDQMLSGFQKRKDVFEAIPGVGFNHLEDPSDVALAGQVRDYQKSVLDQVNEAAKSGKVDQYIGALRQGTKSLLDLRKPGGPIDALEKRVQQKTERDEHFREFFKDNPMLSNFAIKSSKLPSVEYDAVKRTFKPITPDHSFAKDVSDENISKWFNQNLDNIKDTLLKEGVSVKSLDKITSVHDFWQLKGTEFNKLVEQFVSVFPQDFTRSIMQREQAARFFNPLLPDTPDEIIERNQDGSLKTNEKGEYVLNAAHPIGRLIAGYASMGTRKNLIHDRIKDNDEAALEQLKLDRRKDEIDYENQIVFNTMRTRISGVDQPMLDFPFEFGDTGVTETFVSKRIVASMGTGVSEIPSEEVRNVGTKQDFVPNALSGELDSQAPGISGIAQKFENHLNDLTSQGKHKEAFNFLKEKYNERTKSFNQTDIMYNTMNPMNPNSVKAFRAMSEQMIDNKGIANHNSYFVLDPTGKISGKAMQFGDIQDIMDIKLENKDFKQRTGFHGRIKSINDKHPSGNIYTITDKEGRVFQVIGSDASLEESNRKLPAFLLASSMFSPDTQPTTPTQTGIEVVDATYPEGIYSKRHDLYQSDIINNQISDLATQRLDSIDPEEVKRIDNQIAKLSDQLDELEQTPSQDRFQQTTVKLYDGRFHPGKYRKEDTPEEIQIGDNEHFNRILQQIETNESSIR